MRRTTGLSAFELYLALAVMRLEGEAYGASIRREIEARTGRTVSIGAVYATFARLEDAGIVRFTYSSPRPVPGGRSRKFVHLTARGQQLVRRSVAMLGSMLDGLELQAER